MKIQKVYRHKEKLATYNVEALEDNKDCTMCEYGLGSPTVCTPAHSLARTESKLLIVDSKPFSKGLLDPRPSSRVLAGEANKVVREATRDFWASKGHGSVTVDHAIRCAPKVKPKPKAQSIGLDACRGYLKSTIDSLPNLERILTIGPQASESVLGYKVPHDALHPYNWVSHKGRTIPVFSVPFPITHKQNKIEHALYVESLRFALETDIEELNPPPWHLTMHTVESDEDAAEAIAELRQQAYITLDAEWSGRVYGTTPFWLLCLSITGPSMPNKVYVWDQLALERYASELKTILTDSSVLKSGQNIKADYHAIKHGLGVCLEGISFDTRYQKKLYMADDSRASLDVLTHSVGMGGHKRELDSELAEAKKAIKAGQKEVRKEKITKSEVILIEKYVGNPIFDAAVADSLADPATYAYGLVNRLLLDKYNAMDTYGTMLVQEYLNKKIDSVVKEDLDGTQDWRPLKYIWEEVVAPGVGAICKMEEWGVQIDTNALQLYRSILDSEIELNLKKLTMRKDINWASPVQRSAFFYDELNLPQPPDNVERSKRSSSSQSVSWWVSKGLDKNGTLKIFQEYQKLLTYRSRYTDSISKHLAAGGRIHPNYRIDGTKTGRLSCSAPSVHQIPSGGDIHAKSAKNLFVARQGYTLIQADFSQLEYRIASAISGDPVMKGLYTNPLTSEDFHLATAKTISKVCWGIEPHECTKVHRSQAKTVNFALLYGSSTRSLAGSLGITLAEAESVMSSVLGSFKVLSKWIDLRHATAKATGYSWTYWNGHRARRRPIFGIASCKPSEVGTALRQSVNSEVQGTGSDYCLASVAKCVDLCVNKPYDARAVLTVHDSIVFEVPDQYVDDMCPDIKAIMEGWEAYGVPITVDFEVGKRWGAMEVYVFPEDRESGKEYWYAEKG